MRTASSADGVVPLPGNNVVNLIGAILIKLSLRDENLRTNTYEVWPRILPSRRSIVRHLYQGEPDPLNTAG